MDVPMGNRDKAGRGPDAGLRGPTPTPLASVIRRWWWRRRWRRHRLSNVKWGGHSRGGSRGQGTVSV